MRYINLHLHLHYITLHYITYQGSFCGCGNVSFLRLIGHSFAYLNFSGVQYLEFPFLPDF